MKYATPGIWAVPLGLGLASPLLFAFGMRSDEVDTIAAALGSAALCISFIGIALIVTHREKGSTTAKMGVLLSLAPGGFMCWLDDVVRDVTEFVFVSLVSHWPVILGCCLIALAWTSRKMTGVKALVGLALVVFGLWCVLD